MFFPPHAKCMEKSPRIRPENEISGGSIICVKNPNVTSTSIATPTDIPELFNQLFIELPIEAYDLALYFESTYIGRHLTDIPIVIPSTFSLELWKNHCMVHFGLPRTTIVV